MINNNKITKLIVNLPTESIKILRVYAKDHDITMTEAIRRALGLQKFINEEITKGGKILIERKGGDLHQLLWEIR